jgi:hypothetical protein
MHEERNVNSGASERAVIDKSLQGSCDCHLLTLLALPLSQTLAETMSASLAPECNEVKE